MEKFLKKLAYWDGSSLLKNSFAANEAAIAQGAVNVKLKNCKTLLEKLPECVTRLSSKSPDGKSYLFEYLLSQDGVKDFDLLKQLTNCNHAFELIEKKYDVRNQKIIINNYKNLLKNAISKISSLMGNALTELLIKNDQVKFQKLSKMIEDAKIPSEDDLAQDASTSKVTTEGPKFDWVSNFEQAIFSNLSDSDKMGKILQNRVEQIKSQDISDDLKNKLIKESINIFVNASSMISNFEREIELNKNNPEKIKQIRSTIISEIDAMKFPEEIRNLCLMEISKLITSIISELQESLKEERVKKEKGLRDKTFEELFPGIYPKDALEDYINQD